MSVGGVSLNVPITQAREVSVIVMPIPGTIVHLSPSFYPPVLQGIKVYPNQPFRFDFILYKGDLLSSKWGNDRNADRIWRTEVSKLIKYFLASLTIPEKDLWVNLSPYEKDRIIPQAFGLTEMGRDLLAEDYMLKQITASLIYPEDKTGKRFWKRIYEESKRKFGTTSIPVNTFNKVWIVPEKAVIYENAKAATAYVVDAKLKVMLEEDYLAFNKSKVILGTAKDLAMSPNDVNSLASRIVREVVIPELTKEVNEGKNFAQLRQVYNSLILATWYKSKIKDSILAEVYVNKNKIEGIGYRAKGYGVRDKQGKLLHYPLPLTPEAIYQSYLQAFKKGAYNYIKEEIDPVTHQTVPRKYFSGGVDASSLSDTTVVSNTAMLIQGQGEATDVTVDLKKESAGIKAAVGVDQIAKHPDLAMVEHTAGKRKEKKPFLTFKSILEGTTLFDAIKRQYPSGQFKDIEVIGKERDLVQEIFSQAQGVKGGVVLSATVVMENDRMHILIVGKAENFQNKRKIREILRSSTPDYSFIPHYDFFISFVENEGLKVIHLRYVSSTIRGKMRDVFINIDKDLHENFQKDEYSITTDPENPKVSIFMDHFLENLASPTSDSTLKSFVASRYEYNEDAAPNIVVSSIRRQLPNRAMIVRHLGGIDLRPNVLSLANGSGSIRVHIDPAELAAWQGAEGLTFDIVNMRLVNDMHGWLGLN